jgi:hypothetical protein
MTEGDICEFVSRNKVKQSWPREQTAVATKHVHFLQDKYDYHDDPDVPLQA